MSSPSTFSPILSSYLIQFAKDHPGESFRSKTLLHDFNSLCKTHGHKTKCLESDAIHKWLYAKEGSRYWKKTTDEIPLWTSLWVPTSAEAKVSACPIQEEQKETRPSPSFPKKEKERTCLRVYVIDLLHSPSQLLLDLKNSLDQLVIVGTTDKIKEWSTLQPADERKTWISPVSIFHFSIPLGVSFFPEYRRRFKALCSSLIPFKIAEAVGRGLPELKFICASEDPDIRSYDQPLQALCESRIQDASFPFSPFLCGWKNKKKEVPPPPAPQDQTLMQDI